MDDEHPEWLPADWKVCVRVRSSGRKDKYYISPTDGIKFNSKPEVLRYLKDAGNDLKLKEAEDDLKLKEGEDNSKLKEGEDDSKLKEGEDDPKLKEAEDDPKLKEAEDDPKLKEAEDDPKLKEAEDDPKLKEAEDDPKLKEAENALKLRKPNKTISQRTDTEKLPSGWIKEIKITKRGGKTRRDPYYVDPVSGLQFRSMQEVNCYLETKDSGIAESKEDDTNHPIEELKDHSECSTVVAEEPRLIDSKEDKIIAGNESIMSEGGAVEISNSLEASPVGQKEEKDSVGDDQKQEKATPRNKRKKSNHKWMNELPRRTSKRLARVEADSPLELEISNRATGAATEKAQVNTIENTGKSEINTSGDSDKQKEPISEPLKDISSVEEQEASSEAEISTIADTTGKSDIYVSGVLNKQKELSKEDDKNEMDLDSSMKYLLKDPCIEFAVKMLTNAIPIEDVIKFLDNRPSGSSSAAPLGDIWADPCFEFAVKTLTSEIPTDDGSGCRLSAHQKDCNSITK